MRLDVRKGIRSIKTLRSKLFMNGSRIPSSWPSTVETSHSPSNPRNGKQDVKRKRRDSATTHLINNNTSDSATTHRFNTLSREITASHWSSYLQQSGRRRWRSSYRGKVVPRMRKPPTRESQNSKHHSMTCTFLQHINSIFIQIECTLPATNDALFNISSVDYNLRWKQNDVKWYWQITITTLRGRDNRKVSYEPKYSHWTVE